MLLFASESYLISQDSKQLQVTQRPANQRACKDPPPQHNQAASQCIILIRQKCGESHSLVKISLVVIPYVQQNTSFGLNYHKPKKAKGEITVKSHCLFLSPAEVICGNEQHLEAMSSGVRRLDVSAQPCMCVVCFCVCMSVCMIECVILCDALQQSPAGALLWD